MPPLQTPLPPAWQTFFVLTPEPTTLVSALGADAFPTHAFAHACMAVAEKSALPTASTGDVTRGANGLANLGLLIRAL